MCFVARPLVTSIYTSAATGSHQNPHPAAARGQLEEHPLAGYAAFAEAVELEPMSASQPTGALVSASGHGTTR
jgi:hypothetical protein